MWRAPSRKQQGLAEDCADGKLFHDPTIVADVIYAVKGAEAAPRPRRGRADAAPVPALGPDQPDLASCVRARAGGPAVCCPGLSRSLLQEGRP